MKTKTKTTLLAIMSALCLGTTAFAQEIRGSNDTINNAIVNPPNRATFTVTRVPLTEGTWVVRGLVITRMVPTNPGHIEKIGLWAGVESLRLDGYSSLQSASFDTWDFLSGPAADRIIVVPQGETRMAELLAAVYYIPDRVATVQVLGSMIAVKKQ
jgi:hypothetical protein